MFNASFSKTQTVRPKQIIPYTDSELLAISLGYREVADERAYNQRYFILNGKKWIHNLKALRRKLNAEYGRYIDDEELEAAAPEGFGYDVEAFYAYFQPARKDITQTSSFKALMEKVRVTH